MSPERLFRIILIVLGCSVFIVEWKRGYFRQVRGFVASFRPKIRWQTIVLTGILAGLVFILDDRLLHFFQQWNDRAFSHQVMEFGRMIGRNHNFWMATVIAYFVVFVLNRKWLDHVVGAVISALIAGAITTSFKYTILRARPENNLGHASFLNWEGITKNSSLFHSFPSGDVVLVAAATGYFFFLLRKTWYRWLLVCLPLSTAFSRMQLNRHWPSDTFVSLLIGFVIGWAVWNYFLFRSQDQIKSKV